MTVAAYYTKLKGLWDELGSYSSIVCSCGADHKRRQLMQFLIGLNDSYKEIRGQILLLNPLPDVRQAYSSIIQEEKQHSLNDTQETAETAALAVQQDALTALAVRSGQGASSRSNTFNRKPLHCSYCDNNHHVRDTCWKLHGYPLGHPKHKANRFNRQGSRPPYNKSAHPSANYVKEGPTRQEMQSVMNGFSDLQFQQILSIMNNNGTDQSPQPQANVVVTSPSLLQAPYRLPRLILDNGATDHITSPNLLVNSCQNSILPPVIMPSREQAPITSTGTLPLNSAFSLKKNVLGVPSFKVNLMSISRVTRGLKCSITFFPYWCILQDLATKTTIGLGKQRGGLYYLVALASPTLTPKFQSSAAIATKSFCSHVISFTELWHRRLGHLSSSRLNFMANNLLNFPFKLNDACDICALSK